MTVTRDKRLFGRYWRPRARKAVVAAAAALAVLAVPYLMSPAQAAKAAFVQTALKAGVSGSTVAASTTVDASAATTVRYLKVCVRSAAGANLDYNPAWKNVTIHRTGTTWHGSKTLPRGTYTYFACAERFDGTWWNGPSKYFTVTAGPLRVGITKVLTVIEENHSYTQMKGGMPYLWGLARSYGYAVDYTAITHPSLPNYLAIAGGSTFGVTDDASPAAHLIHGQSVFGQALAAGKTARTYAQSMPGTCVTTGDTDKGYAVKHNPWAYFIDERASCAAADVPSAAFLPDARADHLPSVGLLVPNKCNDAHDTDLGCTLGTADTWLQERLPTVLASTDFTSGRLAVIITGDEDNTFPGSTTRDGVLTVVLQAGLDATHTIVTTPLSHYSLSRLYSEVVGAPPLRHAATAPDLATAFDLTLAASSTRTRR